MTRVREFLTQRQNQIFGVLLVLYFLVAGFLMFDQSLTTDEPAHLGAGLSYMYGWGLNPEHPHLLKFFSGLLLFIFTPFQPQSRDQYGIGYEIFFNSGYNPNLIIFLGRLPYLLFNSLFIVYLWVGSFKQYFGKLFAIILAVFYIFSTTLTPFASLSIFDVAGAISALIFISLIYIFQKKLDGGLLISNMFLWAVSLVGFIAVNIKFTNILVLGLIPVLLIFNLNKIDKLKSIFKYIGIQIITLLIGIYTLNGFCYRSLQASTYTSYYEFNFKIRSTVYDIVIPPTKYEIIYKPFLIYLKGLQMSFMRSNDLSNTFFIDKYIPDTFGSLVTRVLPLKENPLLVLLLPLGLIFGLWQTLKNYKNWSFLKSTTLLILIPVIYIVASFGSKLAIGLRHFDLAILAGYALVAYAISKFFVNRWLIAVLLGVYIIFSLPMLYSGIGYSNIFWIKDSYLLASDSTMNWGQNAKKPVEFLVKNNLISDYYNPNELASDFCCSPDLTALTLEFVRPGNPGNKSYKGSVINPDIANKSLQNNPAKYLIIDGNTLQFMIHHANQKSNEAVIENLALLKSKPIIYNYVDQVFVYQLRD